MKKYLLYFFILLLAFARFIYVDRIPAGMSNDEIECAISAKSYALYARDVSGFGIPLSLFKTRMDGKISPIAPLVLSLPLKFLSLNQSTIRIFYVIVNLLTALCLYFLVKTLSSKKNLGLIAATLFLINPWSTYLSREALDTPFALLFYVAGITALLKLEGWKLIIPFFLFILAFFSYIGGQFLFLPVILICLVYKSWSDKIKFLKSKTALGFTAASVIFVLLYILISRQIPESTLFSRSSDLFFTDTAKISSIVNNSRRQIIENPFNNLFLNKPIEIFKTFTGRYLAAFSPDVLFISGDYRATYRFGEHGLLYLLDIPLILLGLTGLYSKNKRVFLFLTGLALISPIATGVSKIEVSVINRSFLLLPVLIIFSTYGLAELIGLFSNKKVKIVVSGLIILILLISTLNFYNFYFLRFPILGQENYWLSERVLDKYLTWNNNQSVEIITDRPRSSYLRAVFFSDGKTQKEILEKLIPYNQNPTDYQIGNIKFTGVCPKALDKNTLYAISTTVSGCKIPDKPDFTIIDQKDAGTLINIYNSPICKGVSKEPWRRFSYISDYSVEKMDYNNFCSRWISIPE